jgi:hypothetical protein
MGIIQFLKGENGELVLNDGQDIPYQTDVEKFDATKYRDVFKKRKQERLEIEAHRKALAENENGYTENQ